MRLRHLIFIIGFSCGWFNPQLGGIPTAFCIMLVVTIIIALLPERNIKLLSREFRL